VNDELMVVRLGLGARTVEYNAGWELQRQIHERRVAGDAGDCCLLLEHDPL
jgi:lipoyl(octanoyl) transferase